MDTYYDVTVWKHNKPICDCEEFSIDEKTRRLEFRNVKRQQNLWSFPIHDDILVWVWAADEKGTFQKGRFHVRGVIPGETNPANHNPNYWFDNFDHTERYESAAWTKR